MVSTTMATSQQYDSVTGSLFKNRCIVDCSLVPRPRVVWARDYRLCKPSSSFTLTVAFQRQTKLSTNFMDSSVKFHGQETILHGTIALLKKLIFHGQISQLHGQSPFPKDFMVNPVQQISRSVFIPFRFHGQSSFHGNRKFHGQFPFHSKGRGMPSSLAPPHTPGQPGLPG